MNAMPSYPDLSWVHRALEAMNRVALQQAEQTDKLIDVCDQLNNELARLRIRVAILERRTGATT